MISGDWLHIEGPLGHAQEQQTVLLCFTANYLTNRRINHNKKERKISDEAAGAAKHHTVSQRPIAGERVSGPLITSSPTHLSISDESRG